MESIRNSSKLHLPRILCLHGGGSNARIFRAQCRSISSRINSDFRLVFVEAPFLSQPGPCVLSVYSEWGPFKRWLPWAPGDPDEDLEQTAAAIDRAIQNAMDRDDMNGATGEWIALMGFSQGAKICASLLFRQQELSKHDMQTPKTCTWISRVEFQFAVLMAGRGPLLWLEPESDFNDDGDFNLDASGPNASSASPVIRLPTLHVHGLQDPNINLHRILLKKYCDKQVSQLVEWNGDHRVPLKSRDVDPVVGYIYNVTRHIDRIS